MSAPATRSGPFFAADAIKSDGIGEIDKGAIAANRVRDDSLPLNELQAFDMSLFAAP
jgi:hypothetical protein